MWKAILVSIALVVFSGAAFAQFGSHDVLYVVTAPAGACATGSRMEVVINTGAIYTCNGTWQNVAGGGGTIGGSGTVGSLPIFVTNTITLGNSNETESGGTLNIATANGIALTALTPALYSGKIQTGTTIAVPAGLDFSIFLGSDSVFRCQLSAGSQCITPASFGMGLSGTGTNIQTTNMLASTNGDVATLDANANTQDSGTLLSNLAATTLNNLASVAVNLALTPNLDNAIALDSLSKRYTNLWLSGVLGGTDGAGTANSGLSFAASEVDCGNGTAGNKTCTFKAGIINAATSFSAGTAPTACGSATGCWAETEASGAGTPTSGQSYCRADSTSHQFKCSVNNGAETNMGMVGVVVSSGTITVPGGNSVLVICTTTCSVPVPVPVAGYQICVKNIAGGSTVITLSALGSSASYPKSDDSGYGTAGTGTMVSSAAAGNKVCLIGRDSTHYELGAVNASANWTVN